MKRWYCPDCGDGLLAPQYLPRNDKRYWCLECSLTSSSNKMVCRYRATSLEGARKMRESELRAIERHRQEREARKAREVAKTIKGAFD